MKSMKWVKVQWDGNSATFTLAPAGSIVVESYVSRTGLTGEQRVITPAWTSTGKYLQVWRYYKDAAHAAWREGVAYHAAPGFKSQHPSEWGGNVATYAKVVTREDLEKVLHFDEPVKGSKPVTDWFTFWAWATRPSTHPKAWPVAQVIPEFATRMLASQTLGQFYELPNDWGKVFPLKAGASLYWDEEGEYSLISRNCPDEVLGSLLSPELAAKRQRWGL